MTWQLKNYRKYFVVDDYKGYVLQVQCCDCNRLAFQNYHPLALYYCPECKLFNCEVVSQPNDVLSPEQKQAMVELEHIQHPDMPRPRFETAEDVQAVLMEFYAAGKTFEEVLLFLEIGLDQENAAFVAKALNKNPKDLERLKAILHSGEFIDDD